MARIKPLTIVVVLCYFATSNKTFGLGRNLQEKDDHVKGEEIVSPEMGRNIRKLLEQALKKIDESDVLRVLKKSLYLRMRMCLSMPRVQGTRSPSLAGKDDHLDDTRFPFNLRETGDEGGFTPDQRLGLRMILQDALKEISDEEILRALKLSLALRIRLCLRAPLRPSGHPRPFPTRFNKRPSSTSEPAQPSSEEPSSPKPNTAKPSLEKPSSARTSTAKPRPEKRPSLGSASSAKPSQAKSNPARPSTGNVAKPSPGKVTSPKPSPGKVMSLKPSPAKRTSAGRKARDSDSDQIFRQNKISSAEEFFINGVSRPDDFPEEPEEVFSQTDLGNQEIDLIRPVAPFPEQIETENREESKLDNSLSTMEAIDTGSMEAEEEYNPYFETDRGHEKITTKKDAEFHSVPEINSQNCPDCASDGY